jgi:hypothetical protein
LRALPICMGCSFLRLHSINASRDGMSRASPPWNVCSMVPLHSIKTSRDGMSRALPIWLRCSLVLLHSFRINIALGQGGSKPIAHFARVLVPLRQCRARPPVKVPRQMPLASSRSFMDASLLPSSPLLCSKDQPS